MNLQSEDKSNKALTVGSLNVLGGMKSDELTAIHTHLQTQDGVQSRIIADMEKLYQSISADGVITANEKQMLKKELTIIETEYPIILAKAETAKKSKADIEKYKEAFQKLYHYIYSELKVFDSMQTPLDIERNTFNAIFAAYYSSRALLQITQDGSTKFLPSLEITGDYENQIGTFQGRLYRWTDGKWELLNAVMPLNPAAHYDMADVQSQWKELYSLSKPIIGKRTSEIIGGRQIHNTYKEGTFYHIHSEISYTGNALPMVIVYRHDWKAEAAILWTFCKGTQDFTVFIPPQDFEFGIGVWMHGWGGYQVQPDDSVSVHKFTVTELKIGTIIDSAGYRNHAAVLGNSITINDKKIGTALKVVNTAVYHRLYTNIFQHGYLESSGQYGVKRFCDLSAYKGKTIRVTVSGYKIGEGGYPCLHIFDDTWQWSWYSVAALDSTTEKTMRATVTIPHTTSPIYCSLFHFPNEKTYNTIVMTRLSIEVIEAKPLNYIGVGKQWTHSRWIKIDENAQDKTTNTRLWMYGQYDYAIMDIAYNNGVVSDISLLCYKDEYNLHWFNIKKEHIIDNQWHNLVVMTDLQESYCWRSFYLDGKKIGEKRTEANFKDFASGDEHMDMLNVNGSLANLLFFDRLLTEQEILYLYLNPQYPVKNYTLADWAIDPDNPDSSIKNLTPKYLGVTETVPTTRTAVIMKGDKLGAQDANPGDWVLMAKTVGGWKVGVCYRWTGSMWINLEPEYNYTEQYQAALYHICEIPELMQNTGHFGALFAKVLVAQKALIDELLVNQAFIKNLVVQKLHIDSDDKSDQDFEAWFDEANGLKINNKGEEMLKVTPDGTLLLAKKIFFNFVQHKDIGNVLYTNSAGESCKDIFNRYGSMSKNAFGYLTGDFIYKITIQKIADANVDYWCFVHLFFGRNSRGFWYKFSIPKDKYLITFFGKDKTYIYSQTRNPSTISYPPDGTKLNGFAGALVYDEVAAEKFHSDKRIYKTSGGGYYESGIGYVGEVVTPGEIFEYNKITEEKNPPAIVLYDDDPYKITSVMKFENIPEAKPSAPNIIWKDGNFLKIS